MVDVLILNIGSIIDVHALRSLLIGVGVGAYSSSIRRRSRCLLLDSKNLLHKLLIFGNHLDEVDGDAAPPSVGVRTFVFQHHPQKVQAFGVRTERDVAEGEVVHDVGLEKVEDLRLVGLAR